ncbi:hypothetical protein [Spirosoma flavum]|uniref:Uncharacterized protein n=1 Tax=Spirosoma flavum TaxID=2048557 RepID=A0ABW6AES4_9BACT
MANIFFISVRRLLPTTLLSLICLSSFAQTISLDTLLQPGNYQSTISYFIKKFPSYTHNLKENKYEFSKNGTLLKMYLDKQYYTFSMRSVDGIRVGNVLLNSKTRPDVVYKLETYNRDNIFKIIPEKRHYKIIYPLSLNNSAKIELIFISKKKEHSNPIIDYSPSNDFYREAKLVGIVASSIDYQLSTEKLAINCDCDLGKSDSLQKVGEKQKALANYIKIAGKYNKKQLLQCESFGKILQLSEELNNYDSQISALEHLLTLNGNGTQNGYYLLKLCELYFYKGNAKHVKRMKKLIMSNESSYATDKLAATFYWNIMQHIQNNEDIVSKREISDASLNFNLKVQPEKFKNLLKWLNKSEIDSAKKAYITSLLTNITQNEIKI